MLIQHIRDVVHLALGIKSVYHLFMYIFNSSFKGSQIQGDLVNMWFETIEELSPEIRKLMVYQLKLNVERRFEDHQGSLSMDSSAGPTNLCRLFIIHQLA